MSIAAKLMTSSCDHLFHGFGRRKSFCHVDEKPDMAVVQVSILVL